MKTLVKIFNWIEWIAAGIGVLFMLFGGLIYLRINVFHFNHAGNYFQIANSFFMLAIVLFLFIHFGKFKKE